MKYLRKPPLRIIISFIGSGMVMEFIPLTVRDFIGSLSLRGTNKGVSVTTSEFPPDASAASQLNPSNRIILIDGHMLSPYLAKAFARR